MPQTLIEKISQRYAVGLEPNYEVRAGDFISIRPAHVMTHDNTGAVIPKFKSIGATKLSNSKQVVFALDHDIQNKSDKNLEKYRKIELFAKEMGNDFYPAGRGIGHQVMIEEGYAWPGTLVVASDSHSNMYGGIGALGTPIVRTDAAAIWATGRTWWQVPPIVKVELKGNLPKGTTGKDVILALCGYFNNDEVLNHVLEFVGDGVNSLSIEQRLSIANMTTEWGALAGVFPIDEVLLNWIKERINYFKSKGVAHPRVNDERFKELENNLENLKADKNAYYAKEVFLNLNSIEPVIAGPHNVKTMTPASKLKEIKINKAYLLSCVNGRVEDFAEAALVVKGKKVADGVKFYIAAASEQVLDESKKRGDWQILLDSGAIELPPSCGPCIGLGEGLLEDGEVGISATNRNFKGRMGSANAEAYLASPAIVAASAITGKITNPFAIESISELKAEIKIAPRQKREIPPVKIVEGFPEFIEGDIIYCHQNNMNTDGIYPGKYTYNDDFKPEDQAKVAMENYDPEFQSLTKKGDILVGGYNFGTGSSREQAATALKYKGIQLVIAGSTNQTYQRNAINNGFLVLESPELVDYLKEKYGTEKPTVATNLKAKIDIKKSKIFFDGKEFSISPAGEAAQELIVQGGLENWVKNNLKL